MSKSGMGRVEGDGGRGCWRFGFQRMLLILILKDDSIAGMEKIGNRWGSLEVTDLYADQREVKQRGVTETFTEHMIELTCDCGEVRKMTVKQFPGRRAMRDCGCGKGRRERCMVVAAYMPVRVIDEVEKIARSRGVTVSRALGDMVTAQVDGLQVVATGKKG